MSFDETMNEYNGFCCCRAFRQSTGSWVSIQLPDMSQMASPEEANQWVRKYWPGFEPGEIKWITFEEFQDGWEG